MKKKKKEIIHLKKEVHTEKKKKGKNSITETKFDKFGNKFSILETSNYVDEEKRIKENNILLYRDSIASFPSAIVDSSYKHNT